MGGFSGVVEEGDDEFFNLWYSEPMSFHHTEFDSTMPVPTEPIYESDPYDTYLNDLSVMTYLLIRELDEDGSSGEWHRIPFTFEKVVRNDPSDILANLGFDRFGSVTWLSGLEEDKQYQVKIWIDINLNGELDMEGRYTREYASNQIYVTFDDEGNEVYLTANEIYVAFGEHGNRVIDVTDDEIYSNTNEINVTFDGQDNLIYVAGNEISSASDEHGNQITATEQGSAIYTIITIYDNDEQGNEVYIVFDGYGEEIYVTDRSNVYSVYHHSYDDQNNRIYAAYDDQGQYYIHLTDYVPELHSEYYMVDDDYYRWVDADLYSDIHNINTNPDAFDVDVDNDGTMDFFVDIGEVEVDNVVSNVVQVDNGIGNVPDYFPRLSYPQLEKCSRVELESTELCGSPGRYYTQLPCSTKVIRPFSG